MKLHISDTFCGARGGWRVSIPTMARHHVIVAALMVLFGCPDCLNELRDALRNARRIA